MELLLPKGEMICFDDDLRGTVVRCHSGDVWLTQPGDSRDHLLGAGDQTEITIRGRIVLMALIDCRLQMLPAKQQAGRPRLFHIPATSTP